MDNNLQQKKGLLDSLFYNENKYKVSKNEIYYAFKKNYNRDYHGDAQSYLKWLYFLAQVSKKKANNSISAKNKACSGDKIDEVVESKDNVPLSVETANNIVEAGK